MVSLDLLGGACLILAALLVLVYWNGERRYNELAAAYSLLDEHNLSLTDNVASLANHFKLEYPPERKTIPEKVIPEKTVISWKSLKK